MTNEELIAEARKLLDDYPHYQEYPGGPLLKYPHQDSVERLADALEAAEARVKVLEAERDASDRAFRALKDQSAACDVERLELREHIAELEAGIEWEYCYRSTRTGNRFGSGSLLDAQLGAKAISAKIERRRAQGSWQPVESEGEEA